MIRILYAIVLLQVMLSTPQVQAHETETHYDRVHLSASASAEVDNDTVIASLYAEAEGSDVSQLSKDVNARIRWALERVKGQADIETQTSAYSTRPVYRDKKHWGWRVRQTIRLESHDMVLVSGLLGELQQQLALQDMHFAVSSQRKRKVDDELIKQAIQAFEQRARLVVSRLSRKNYRLVDIKVTTSDQPVIQRQYVARAMAMSTEASPAVEAGEQTLQVTVSGEVELE